ncbi:protein SUBSTANDARD STARCH GRAIN 4, chloroplastic-like isoform X1 [Phragmites australis]|uniref:protein SUBSTANDARD STARCH GRAIN 4, chloroplastic-like isoform X1 n=1 Tax=Phragmites australis TaxID=29695 RepID=UPI002D779ED3|nr:protein SUBSTANDARD STARCH GRAIN 4, chloroplastic-like isoform X1 [Phragmites australis]
MSHCLRVSPFLAPPPPLFLLQHPARRRRSGHPISRPLLTLARFDPPPLLRLKVADSSDFPGDAAHAHHSNHHAPLLPRPRALIGSLAPVWREGLFLVRCSVFAAVVSVAAALSWFAQLRARSFVEARLLPAACAALGEYLQREVRLGKVRSVSPLGITLQTCSIGPHAEEFSCAEVPVMKIRVRPFASLRRGRVVVDAVLSEPTALVAQKKDFSWLGIPAPSEGTLKRHSGEEGIDYRTKTRRLAREKAAKQWNEERDKAAREAAERGYTIPCGQSVSPSTDQMLEVDGSTEIGKSSPPLCADEMHKKDHHMATGIDSGSKHADLEKSFGVKSRIPGINLWSRMISSPRKLRYRRKAHGKVVSDIDNSSQQRILRRSADAAVACFQSKIGRSNLDDSSPGQGKSSSDGGHTNFGCDETASNVGRPIGSSKTASTNFSESPSNTFHSMDYSGKGKYSSAVPIISSDDAFNGRSHNQLFSQCSSCNLDSSRLVCHHLEDLQLGQANFSQCPVLGKFENCSEDKLGPQQEIIFGNFGSCTHSHNWVSFWPFQLKGFPVSLNAPCASLDVQIQKLKSQFAIGPGDISAELSEGVSQIHPGGVQQALPITLDSVYFNGGNLMLLGYGDQEPREMKHANGHIKFKNSYNRVHVHVTGNCMEWRQDRTSQGGGYLSTDVFVDIAEQTWHANLNVLNAFVPLFERILQIPVIWHKGRTTGEVHICMSKGDSFPSIHGQLDVKGLAFQILDAPSSFSDIVATLSFRGQRVFLHNASGWFGDAPVEASGDFGLNPEDGEFHLLCQVPSVEVNALMRTMKMRSLMFPLAGAVTAVFNCQGPLDAPVFVGSGIVSRKSPSISGMPPSAASEAVMQNKEAGAVAAFDHIPFSHVSANFTFNLDNCVADLYGIRACLLDGGEIRGAGNAWICPEGGGDDSAMDINLSGSILLDKVLHRYIPGGIQLIPVKIGELNGETRLSGSFIRPKFDIKWAAPNAEDSFSDARGSIVIAHDYIMVNSSSVAFDLNTRVQTSYIDDYLLNKDTYQMKKIMPLIVEGVDLDLRMRGFEFAHIASSIPFDSPRPLHLKASGRVKFQGKVMKSINIVDGKMNGILQNIIDQNKLETDVSRLVGNISLSGIKLNQLMLSPQSTGSLSISRDSMMLNATGRPDEKISIEVNGPLFFSTNKAIQDVRLLSVFLQKGQLRSNICYHPESLTSLEVRNLPLDELEFASLRGFIQKAELQLNFQKRRGHGLLSVIRPKFSGMLGEALDIAARWSGDVITLEKSVLEQANSKYEVQGEYVFPGTRDRFPVESQSNGFIEKAMGGHLGSIMSSMGRWRMRLEVPGAEVAEMLPLARLLSRSTDPVIRSRSKELFMQCLNSVGFNAESLHDQRKALEMYHDWLDDDTMEDITLPGLAELRGYWRGSLDASGGGNGDTMVDFDFNGEDWEWGTYMTQRVLASGSFSNNDGLRFDKLFIQKDNATLHADGSILGPLTNLHFAVLNFPVGLIPALVQAIESSTTDSIHFLRQWLTPIKGILHMEGDLRGTLAKPECDVQIRLLDGTIGGIDLGRAEVLASVTPTSRFVFDANFEPTIQSGHVNIQGSIPVTYVDSSSKEESLEEEDGKQGIIRIPVWAKDRGSSNDISEARIVRDKTEEGWDFQLAESLKGLSWNMLEPGEVRINADIKDGGMMLITALSPYANWLQGYADVLLQVKGTVDQPVVDGSASFHRATGTSPFLRTPLTNFAGTIHVISNRLCISSMESRVGRKGRLSMKGTLPLKNSEPSANDKIELKCEVLDVRAKNILSGQVDSQLQVTGSILRPDVSGMIWLSHGEAYLPHDKGNGAVATRLVSNKSSYLPASFDQSTTSQDASHILGSLSTSPDRKQSDTERTLEHGSFKPNIDARLNDLKLILGPELRIVYPLILNFAVSGDLELNGMVHPKYIRPKGILTFENGEVNLVATQVRLKNDHLNVAKFEPDLGLDPILDLILVGSEWKFKIQSRASMWQDNLVVTSTRSVDQDVLSPSEAAKVFESQLAESLLEGDGQLAFKKLATATLETLMPRIEGKGEFGQARWRMVYAPQIPSLLSLDPTVDPLKSLANNISFATEVEVQLGRRLRVSVVRQMKDSEMAMQWTLIYQLTSRLRVLFQSTPSNRLLFEYSATSQD